MATMLSSSSRPDVVPLTMASMVESAVWPMSPSVPPVWRCLASGTMIRLMRIAAGGVGNDRRQNGGVEHEHGAGDAGHAAGHHHEHFAARQFGEIRPDEQRRLDLADERSEEHTSELQSRRDL